MSITGNMEDEVSSFLSQLDDDTFSAVTIRGNRESRNCLPGPRLFSPTVEQKLAVLLLEIYDQNNVLSQGVLSRLTAGEQQMQGESLIRIMEILVWDFHLYCLDKGFTRTIVPERLVDRRQPKGTQASEESRKLTGGDCFFHRVNGRIFDASVYVNDPFLGMIITSNKRCIPYEDIVLTGYQQSRHTASCTPEETGSEVESFQLYLSESGNESDTGRDPTWTLPPKSPPEVVVPSTMGTRTTSIRKRKREDMQQEQERTKKRTNPAKKFLILGRGPASGKSTNASSPPTSPLASPETTLCTTRSPRHASTSTTGLSDPSSDADIVTLKLEVASLKKEIKELRLLVESMVSDTTPPSPISVLPLPALSPLNNALSSPPLSSSPLSTTFTLKPSATSITSTHSNIITESRFWDLRVADLPCKICDINIKTSLDSRNTQQDVVEEARQRGGRSRKQLAKELYKTVFTLRETYKRNVYGMIKSGQNVTVQPFDIAKMAMIFDVVFNTFPPKDKAKEKQECVDAINQVNRYVWGRRMKGIEIPPMI
ncbi:uncharacterized protein LOC124148413 isoform X1 [Haliotis rufescens]|uniref:uncharacterized protein LOC124148413 isoform X1 n=1 Tax=Haliotis rufescens TaxID=6454 RepID=UPI00201F4935|nr:uncharacterized protein LOC124148413 isoform X1 [Haliotis rufescens]